MNKHLWGSLLGDLTGDYQICLRCGGRKYNAIVFQPSPDNNTNLYDATTRFGKRKGK